jgi:drug/metabolite transporter (DMT)-like permease
MTPLAAALVLTGSVMHAAWNLIAKRVPDGGATFVWIHCLLSTVLMVPVVWVWLAVSGTQLHASWLLACAASAVMHVVYSVLLQWGYSAGDMNITYPISRGVGPLLTVLVAVAVFGERISVYAGLGVAAIIAGITVISTGATATDDPRRRRAGVVYGMLTGIAIAGYTLWDAHAVGTLAVPAIPYFMGSVAVQCVLLSPLGLRRRRQCVMMARRHWKAGLAVAVLSPTSYILVLFALTMAPVALVAPLRSTSIVLGSLAAWILLREANPGRRLLGACVVVAGIAFVVAG